ncbi:MAG: hypothetical protein JWP04_3013 [Belnapia sp.]|nr:hypothetical protein [Belnapia sp.]
MQACSFRSELCIRPYALLAHPWTPYGNVAAVQVMAKPAPMTPNYATSGFGYLAHIASTLAASA